jgi:hypothetical protein
MDLVDLGRQAPDRDPQGLSPAAPEIEEFLRRRFRRQRPGGLLRFAEQLLAEEDQVRRPGRCRAAGAGVVRRRRRRLAGGAAGRDGCPARRQDRVAARLRPLPGAECPDATVQALIDFWASH